MKEIMGSRQHEIRSGSLLNSNPAAWKCLFMTCANITEVPVELRMLPRGHGIGERHPAGQ